MRSVLLGGIIIIMSAGAATAGGTCFDKDTLDQQFPGCVTVDIIYGNPARAQTCPCGTASLEDKKDPSELATPAMTGVTVDHTLTLSGTTTSTCTIHWVDGVAIKRPPGCTVP